MGEVEFDHQISGDHFTFGKRFVSVQQRVTEIPPEKTGYVLLKTGASKSRATSAINSSRS